MSYYTSQSGGGMGDIGSIYRSPMIIQQGRGIGGMFTGLARFIRPLFASSMMALKDQAFTTGKNILKDIGHKPLNDILKEQAVATTRGLAEKAVNKVQRKMSGGARKAIKRKKSKKVSHSRVIRGTKRLKRDIFGY